MATYYWIGGNGTWDNSNTANWSNAPGGASGFGPPLSTDTVIFDSTSGTGTCTTAAGSACATATLNSSTLSLVLGANHTMSGAFTLTLGALSLTGNSGNWTLACSAFVSSNSNARSIAFGTGNITVTGNNLTVWHLATATNFTYTGTATVNCTYAGATGTRSITQGAGSTASNVVNINVSAGTDSITGTLNVNNLNLTGFGGTVASASRNVYGNLTIGSATTVAASASGISFVGTSGTQQITTNGVALDIPLAFNGVGGTFQLQDNCTVGSTRTVTLTNGTLDLNNQTLSTGLFGSSNSNTRTVAFGTGNITLTGSGATIYTTSTATNLSFTGTPVVNCIYAGATGTRTITPASTSGSIATMPTINVSAGSDTVLFTNTSATGCVDLDFTGFTGTCSSLPRNIYGNTTFVSGMTLTNTSTIVFASTSGTKTITTANLTLDCPITFNGIGGTWEFADALTQGSTRAFTVINGTVKLKAGVTSTVGAFATSGSNQKYLQSTTAGSQATLSQASGTVTVSYLSIKDIAATGGATWNAYVDYNNVDQGDNTGWDFSYSPTIDNEFPVALRSFTQPKRF